MDEGTQQSKKRKISVGFIKPEELEGNTIYVQLLQYFSNMPEHVYAEAVSKEDFRCIINYAKSSTFVAPRKETSNVYTGIRMNHERFLEMLKKENDAEIEERFKQDGLELTARLTDELKSNLLSLKFGLHKGMPSRNYF